MRYTVLILMMFILISCKDDKEIPTSPEKVIVIGGGIYTVKAPSFIDNYESMKISLLEQKALVQESRTDNLKILDAYLYPDGENIIKKVKYIFGYKNNVLAFTNIQYVYHVEVMTEKEKDLLLDELMSI